MIGGAGTVLGGFRVALGLDTTDYATGIINADALTRVFGQSVTTFLANPLLGAVDLFGSLAGAVANAAGAFAQHSTRVLGNAEEIERLGQVTGATTDLVQALAGRMEQAGFGADKAELGLRTLNRRLGEARQGMPEAVRLFEQLNINVNALGTTDQALAALLDQLERMPDAGQRAAIASRLLGDEGGAKLVNAIGGGSDALRKMVDEQRALGQVIDGQTVNSLAGFNTVLGKTQQLLAGSSDVLLANFIAGFIEETAAANVNIDRLGESIQQKLVPLARELGQEMGELVGNLDDVIERIDRILQQIETSEALALANGVSEGVKAGFNQIGFVVSVPVGIAQKAYQLPDLIGGDP